MLSSKPIKIAIGIASSTILLAGCGTKETSTKAAPRPVQYVQVTPGTGENHQTYSGTTKSHVDAQISFKVAGTVTERPVSIGDKVSAGDLLARLDARDYRVAVQDAQAALAAARAESRNAAADYERTVGLYENRNASKAELDAAEAAAESSKAQVASASERRHAAQLQESYTQLTAPQECTVAETYVKENENVDVGQPVVRLNCGRCAEVESYLPETHIGYVAASMDVTVTLDAFADQSFDATVTEVGVASGAGSSFPVTAILTGDCPAMRSGLAADMHIVFARPGQEGNINVPVVSVGEDDESNYVFVLEKDEDSWIARRRSVKVGEITDQAELEITKGLTEGEYIATAGVRRIQDGMAVRLHEAGGLDF